MVGDMEIIIFLTQKNIKKGKNVAKTRTIKFPQEKGCFVRQHRGA